MIGRVTFELPDGSIISPDADYGMYLVNYDAPPPKAKTYTVKLDGADGTLDMSQWAGRILFDDREVTVNLRDMGEQYADLISRLHGRRMKIRFSDEPEHYYEGRCTAIDRSTRRHITDMGLKFQCVPYKLRDIMTTAGGNISSALALTLKGSRMPAVPTITLSAACTLTYGGNTYSLSAGTHTVAGIVITETPQTLNVSGSGTIKLQWRDGDL